MNNLVRYGEEEVNLIKEHLMDPDATPEELDLFLYQARTTGLNALAKQIYPVHRYDRRLGRKKMTIQVSIDGLRLIAERTGEYEGQEGPYWCGDDGVWHDVWLSDEYPRAAKVGVWRKGFKQPLWRVARWESFAQEYQPGKLSTFWASMGEHMLAKCAESLALRAAFPQELSGLYTSEEMDQVDVHDGVYRIETKQVDAHLDQLISSLPGAIKVHPEIQIQDLNGHAIVDSQEESETEDIIEDIKGMASDIYDDPDDMYKKWFKHYGVSGFEGMDRPQILEIHDGVSGLFTKLISGEQLKALHAKAGDLAKAMRDEDPEEDWDWDIQRPMYVKNATGGRTESSKKLYVEEFKQIMEYMDSVLAELSGETGNDLFS